MREVRISMNDNVHKSLKTYSQNNDMTMNEAIEHLLKAGLRTARKEEKDGEKHD